MTLQDLGAVPSNIVWIHRFSANAAAWCDHDKIIHEKITKSISRLGVRVRSVRLRSRQLMSPVACRSRCRTTRSRASSITKAR